jgi:hypothetical protein
MPRPTRFLLAVAPFGGCKVDKFVGTLFPLIIAATFTQQLLGFPVYESGDRVIGSSGDRVSFA